MGAADALSMPSFYRGIGSDRVTPTPHPETPVVYNQWAQQFAGLPALPQTQPERGMDLGLRNSAAGVSYRPIMDDSAQTAYNGGPEIQSGGTPDNLGGPIQSSDEGLEQIRQLTAGISSEEGVPEAEPGVPGSDGDGVEVTPTPTDSTMNQIGQFRGEYLNGLQGPTYFRENGLTL